MVDQGPPAAALTGALTTLGLDMGGTFVDCVVARPGLPTVEAKAPTTPDDPVSGIMAAVRAAAAATGIGVRALLGGTGAIVHGTTLGLNTLLGGDGARVGLLTTRGHEDAILIGRVRQKVAGLRPHEMTRVADLRKPPPLVPRQDIEGIHERIDAAGQVVVRLDEAGVVAAADRLLGRGCEALVVAFLWSHVRPEHEQRAAALIARAHPTVHVVCSSAVAPVIGEYERTTAAVVNAALLARFSGYLGRLQGALGEAGFAGRVWIMGMTGGVMPLEAALASPVETLRSGPVGGIMASARTGERLGRSSLIATDMGGTSFDVGLIVDGEAQHADITVVGQVDLATPAVAIRSIGAGGGSVVSLDELGGLHVGPRSAGAFPGPACYGRGGREPTVTDADLMLGRLDPRAVLGGGISLDPEAARQALAPLAERLGLGLVEAAGGIVRVADAQMADLVRTATLERGHDPRQFTLVAYGGAGPVHVGRFAADVGVREVIVPASASVFSALGLATARYRRTYRRSRRLPVPLVAALVGPVVRELTAQARGDFATSGLDGALALAPWVDMRYRRQTHQLRVPGVLDDRGEMDVEALGPRFEALYERTFGHDTGYAAAGLECTAIGLHAMALAAVAEPQATGSARRRRGTGGTPRERHRPVWFDGWRDSPIVEAGDARLVGGVDGPAIVEWGATSLVVHPGQCATVDDEGNLRLQLSGEARP
ncbi:MAG TPA: hydantoinase/oxoprolinase family protein [Candidatus Limnocylindrales bacterium]|jgi:N-methylhydantoinase A